jgi:zinc transport system ATP-binding protein
MTKSGKWYMKSIVEFQHVSKSYGEQVVIDDVGFCIESATITTMIGPNGAGKTTIARLILGIDSPTSGKILRTSNKTAYVPQKISINTSLPMDVKSLVKYLSGTSASDISKVIEFAKIDSLADKQISQLSGGQLQRVFLGIGLLSKPDLIVLDEPTQGLDIQGQQEFYEIIAGVRDKTGAAIFMISHDLHAVMKSSDKVLCLNHHICCEGKPGVGHKEAPQVAIYSHHHDHNH